MVTPPSAPIATPEDQLDLEESVAGEEDPGSSIDLATEVPPAGSALDSAKTTQPIDKPA